MFGICAATAMLMMIQPPELGISAMFSYTFFTCRWDRSVHFAWSMMKSAVSPTYVGQFIVPAGNVIGLTEFWRVLLRFFLGKYVICSTYASHICHTHTTPCARYWTVPIDEQNEPIKYSSALLFSLRFFLSPVHFTMSSMKNDISSISGSRCDRGSHKYVD